MFSDALLKKAEEILQAAREKSLTIATAESCTGGLLASLLTDIPGSSDVFDRGFITYSYESKIELLGVDAALLKKQGAVSEAVARAMAEGAKIRLNTGLAIAVTGIAGPGGGTEQKPVGTVCFAIAGAKNVESKTCHFTGTRYDIRMQSVAEALDILSCHTDLAARS